MRRSMSSSKVGLSLSSRRCKTWLQWINRKVGMACSMKSWRIRWLSKIDLLTARASHPWSKTQRQGSCSNRKQLWMCQLADVTRLAVCLDLGYSFMEGRVERPWRLWVIGTCLMWGLGFGLDLKSSRLDQMAQDVHLTSSGKCTLSHKLWRRTSLTSRSRQE